jgi:hypothetical protein
MAFPGYLGPAIAALVVIASNRGKMGIDDLFSRLVRRRLPLRWYLIEITLPAISVLLVFSFLIFERKRHRIQSRSNY